MKPIALVTGGGRGIGLGIARCLAQDGFDLAICGVRSPEQVRDTIEELRQLGADLLYVQADVADGAARKQLLDAVRNRFGRLNVLVNNAGRAPSSRVDILDAAEQSFDEVLATNLRGPYFLTQAAARWMIERRKADPKFWACIVNISSVSATVVSVNRGEYCISKAGVAMASQLWAARLGEFDIPVYEVRPGIIRSDMTAAVTAKYEQLFSEGLAPQARWGMPEDVGRAVAALARGDFKYSTGSILTVDGGLTIQRM